jgi:hypothetical protein
MRIRRARSKLSTAKPATRESATYASSPYENLASSHSLHESRPTCAKCLSVTPRLQGHSQGEPVLILTTPARSRAFEEALLSLVLRMKRQKLPESIRIFEHTVSLLLQSSSNYQRTPIVTGISSVVPRPLVAVIGGVFKNRYRASAKTRMLVSHRILCVMPIPKLAPPWLEEKWPTT